MLEGSANGVGCRSVGAGLDRLAPDGSLLLTDVTGRRLAR